MSINSLMQEVAQALGPEYVGKAFEGHPLKDDGPMRVFEVTPYVTQEVTCIGDWWDAEDSHDVVRVSIRGWGISPDLVLLPAAMEELGFTRVGQTSYFQGDRAAVIFWTELVPAYLKLRRYG